MHSQCLNHLVIFRACSWWGLKESLKTLWRKSKRSEWTFVFVSNYTTFCILFSTCRKTRFLLNKKHIISSCTGRFSSVCFLCIFILTHGLKTGLSVFSFNWQFQKLKWGKSSNSRTQHVCGPLWEPCVRGSSVKSVGVFTRLSLE